MRSWTLPLQPRFIGFTAVVVGALSLSVAFVLSPSIYIAIPLVVCAALTVIGTVDLIQTRHAVLRNYPLTAHIRFILEGIRPEIRQYFLESEKDGTPFSRDKRAIVYQRAKEGVKAGDLVLDGPTLAAKCSQPAADWLALSDTLNQCPLWG
jgi:hypothetical protein